MMMRNLATAGALLIAACATTQAPLPTVPAAGLPYIISQISFHHGATVMVGPDAGHPTSAMLKDAIDSTVAAYSEAKHVSQEAVVALLEKFHPAIYMVDKIDCAKAHGGAGCGGFIASDNTIHLVGDAVGCLANTSFVHFLLHYFVGCQTGAMDIEHTDSSVFKDVEGAVNLHITQTNAACHVPQPMPHEPTISIDANQ